jgi:uncharacterized membrane protein HdeD (DUF308 family)
MTAADVQNFDIQFTKGLAQYWGWFLLWGVLLLAIGIAAVWRSMTATLVSMQFFGWLLAFAAAIEIVSAVMVGHWAGFFQHALAAILFGVLALIFIVRPVITAEVLTLVMALFFLVGGLFQIVGSAALGFSPMGSAVKVLVRSRRRPFHQMAGCAANPGASAGPLECSRLRLHLRRADRAPQRGEGGDRSR